MTANHAGGEQMAGSHKVKVSRPDSRDWFEVTAQPENRLSRLPVLGPFITYNLGRNPKFAVKVKHLGYGEDPDDLDAGIQPLQSEAALWQFDLVLMVDGQPMTHSEDLQIDLVLTGFEKKQQRWVTSPWPLTQPGRAELQIGPVGADYLTLFSFEIRDNTVTAANWIFGLFTGVAGGVIGAVLTRLASSD